MLNRSNRLVTASDFRNALRRGKKIAVRGGLVAVSRTDADSSLRCGFVVSKAVGNAVVRNLVKRRLRAACSTLVTTYSSADVVVRADQHAPGVSVEQWRDVLASVLDQVVGT